MPKKQQKEEIPEPSEQEEQSVPSELESQLSEEEGKLGYGDDDESHQSS